jgi:plastocyanin
MSVRAGTFHGIVNAPVRDSFPLVTFITGWNGGLSAALAGGEEVAMRNRPGRPAWWRWALVALGPLVVSTGTHALAVTTPTIGIKEFTYRPPIVTVRPGTTVTWVNHDEEPHTVTSATGAFASPGLVNEDTFAQTFTTPGTYQYFCALHPHMRATVVVK